MRGGLLVQHNGYGCTMGCGDCSLNQRMSGSVWVLTGCKTTP